MLYLPPFYALLDGFAWKAAAASVFVFVWDLLGRFVAVDVDLAALLVLLVIIDFVTGVLSAYKSDETVSSRGLRQTIIKVLEYALFCLTCTAVGNTLGTVNLPVLSAGFLYLGPLGYAFCILTEARSIFENTGNMGWLAKLKDLTDSFKP